MSILTDTLAKLSLGAPQVHQNLAVFPLLGDEAPRAADYLLLDEALDQGCARVTEVSQGGSVPELRFENDCTRPVLILDGEELVGAKQNRVLNLSVLAPAGQTIIPVSCVEAGRWRHTSAAFRSGGRAHYASGRANKARAVSASLAAEGTRRSDQGEVWADIDAKMSRMGADSGTRAAAAMFESRQEQLAAYRGAMATVPGQCGALFAIAGRFAGLDLFDSPETLAKVLPKLVESVALDAIDRTGEGGEASPEYLETVLSDVAVADVQAFPGVGLGEDLRVSAPNLSGGALVADARVLHLYAFPVEGEPAGQGRPRTRMARASQRRRR